MKKLVLIGALVATSSSYALELKNAEILEHRSWFSSPDNKITIIAGHIVNHHLNGATHHHQHRTSQNANI